MDPKRKRPIGLLFFLVLLAASLILVSLELRNLGESRAHAVHLAEVHTRNLAQAMDLSVSATVGRIDQGLRTVTAEMERSLAAGRLDRTRLEVFIATQQALLPEAVAIRVTDAEGTILLNKPSQSASSTLRDRPFWSLLQADPAAGLCVSRPHIGLFTKRWIFSFARRYNLPDGRFGGIVVLPVFVDHFQKALTGFEVGTGGTLTLRDSDGGFVARHPAVLEGETLRIGDREMSEKLRTIITSGSTQSTFQTVTPFDGASRILTFRRMSQVPMFVLASLAEVDYLSQWRAERRRTLARLVTVLLGIWLLSGVLWRGWEGRERGIRALAESEFRYRTQFDRASEGISLVSSEGLLLEANESFLRMHGFTWEELKGRRLKDLDTPDSYEHAAGRIRCLEAGEVLTFEVNHVHKAGHVFPLEVSASKVTQGGSSAYLCFHRDITERKLAQEAMQKDQSRLLKAELVARFGSWELDLANRKMRASVGAGLIYGLEGRAWNIDEVQHMVLPEYRPTMDAALTGLIEHRQPYNIEFQIRRAGDGELRTVHSVAEYDPAKHTVLGVIHDITEKKLDEEEKHQLQAQLQHAHKMESLGSLAGGVAHDMNNVLGAILGLASVQGQQAPPGSTLKRSLETIATACQRGAKLVKGLLGFARQSLAEEKVLDLNSLVREEMELLERTTLQKVRLETDLAEPLLPVTGDPGALGHALMNLCVNAVDAMEPGGLLTVRTRNDGTSRVLLEVLDTGSGMPAEVLAKAMDPFFTTKPLGKGTGLGLSIVYGTVKAHGGTISIQSEPGRGSRVAIHLPASSSREAEIGEAAQLPFSPSGEALLLLLVDDDELVQESLVAMLETLGHEVRVTSSGKAACAELECGLRPDAIVLDMNMPGLDGAATLPLLRSLLPGVPILLSTGRSNQAVLDLVNNTLDVFLLPKPFDLRVLQEHLMILPKVPKPAVP